MSKLIQLNEDNFDETINGDVPVLVDYYAEWCAPCKALMPTVEESSEKWNGKVVVAKLNIEDDMEVARKEGIRSIPTLALYHKGVRVIITDKTSKGIDDAIENALQNG